MKREMKQSIIIAATLALSLAGCQKSEETPAPQTQAPATTAPATPAPGQGSTPQKGAPAGP